MRLDISKLVKGDMIRHDYLLDAVEFVRWEEEGNLLYYAYAEYDGVKYVDYAEASNFYKEDGL